ncbi:MAG: BREX-6 system BrxE protein [Myxococcales bacterium]|nr:BREX-6 system BrxE protein [Myxococcales bacterium]
MAAEPLRERLQDGDLDALLTAQLLVAWAGETGRLGWWRSTLVSRYGGYDLFSRLTPHTTPWVLLQAARETARRHDAARRAQSGDADARLTLFHLGFTHDEQADERLQHHKRVGTPPLTALPVLGEFIRLPTDDGDDDDESFDRDRFEAYLRRTTARFEVTRGGRRLIGAPPADLTAYTHQLLAAHAPLSAEYPLPYFQRKP